jgi:UDP-2-acetamido-3-amino-2,3-dideoxy-glucuronate N-acetyltransferase
MNLFHKTAIIDHGATIGSNTKVWHWTHICSGAVIGKDCSLGQNVFVSNKVLIGNNVKIQNNVSIYDNVTLEDNVFCGPSMVFTNVINPRSSVSRKDKYKNTIVKKGATLGANCTLICGVTIGEHAFIGAGSVITKNVPDYALIVGVPGKCIGWMSEFGERMHFSDKGSYVCSESKDRYILLNGLCKKVKF